ncbi:MAG: hypothetical protein KIS92_10690 [Planctomycetota bacterium]|nr:hypothetical protein [Planctomycetota bacterium]
MKIAHGIPCLAVAALAMSFSVRAEEAKKVVGSSSVKVEDKDKKPEKKEEKKAEPIKAPVAQDDALTTALGKALNKYEPWGDDDKKATGYKYKGAMFRTYKPTVERGEAGTKVVVKIVLVHALRTDDWCELELNYGKAADLTSARAVVHYNKKNQTDTGVLTSPITVAASDADPALASRNMISRRLLNKLLDGIYKIDEEGSREWFVENVQRHLHLISDLLPGTAKGAQAKPAAPAKTEVAKAK